MANYTSVAISAGHGKYVAGATGNGIKEHEEACKVAKKIADIANANGCSFKYFEETTAKTQSQNLNNIVLWHNRQSRQLDVSVHFNAASPSATGTEVLVYGTSSTTNALARKVSAAISKSLGIVDRGIKARQKLRFIRGTNKPSILIEVCFVSNPKDVAAYKKNFNKMCEAIFTAITGKVVKKEEKSLNQATKGYEVESNHIGTFKNTKKVTKSS